MNLSCIFINRILKCFPKYLNRVVKIYNRLIKFITAIYDGLVKSPRAKFILKS